MYIRLNKALILNVISFFFNTIIKFEGTNDNWETKTENINNIYNSSLLFNVNKFANKKFLTKNNKSNVNKKRTIRVR